jgi:hypothetical protein
MEDWQLRVVEEKDELDKKASKLVDFIMGEKSANIQGDERYLLIQQRNVMLSYSDILAARINLFY